VRYDTYTIELTGTMLTVFGDGRAVFSMDLFTCTQPSGRYNAMVNAHKAKGLHEGAQSALGRVLSELLDPILDEGGVHSGRHRLQLDRFNAEVANAFSRDASRYSEQTN
jgi:hypothetical protein